MEDGGVFEAGHCLWEPLQGLATREVREEEGRPRAGGPGPLPSERHPSLEPTPLVSGGSTAVS